MGERECPTPDAPHPSRRRPPPWAPSCRPHRAQGQLAEAGSPQGGMRPQARQGDEGTGPPPQELHRRNTGPGLEAWRGTNRHERPYRCPTPKPRVVCAPDQPRGGGPVRRGSRSAHTHNGHAARTRRATNPSPWNAQTTWDVPASEGKGYPGGTTRNTHREGRQGRDEFKGRSENRHRPRPPKPAASATHTRPGHCAHQGSRSTQCYAPAPRLGSLRASPWGSYWRQASSTGPAAPAPRATTH